MPNSLFSLLKELERTGLRPQGCGVLSSVNSGSYHWTDVVISLTGRCPISTANRASCEHRLFANPDAACHSQGGSQVHDPLLYFQNTLGHLKVIIKRKDQSHSRQVIKAR